MHPAADEWVRRYSTGEPVTVLDIGGRDINGTARRWFPNATRYVVLDILAGPGVDIVADAATWTPDQAYDLVVATEVFEHAERWREIVVTAFTALRPGGQLVATMAGPGRPTHSGVDGEPRLHPGEWYANIDPDELRAVTRAAGYGDITVDIRAQPSDVRLHAVKPMPVRRDQERMTHGDR